MKALAISIPTAIAVLAAAYLVVHDDRNAAGRPVNSAVSRTVATVQPLPASTATVQVATPVRLPGLEDILLVPVDEGLTIGELEAVAVASKHVVARQTLSSPQADAYLATNIQERDPNAPLFLQSVPVWVVSWEKVIVERSGPAQSAVPRGIASRADVLINAVTGDYILTSHRSLAPVAAPEPDFDAEAEPALEVVTRTPRQRTRIVGDGFGDFRVPRGRPGIRAAVHSPAASSSATTDRYPDSSRNERYNFALT